MAKFTPQQIADRVGRLLVTKVDGRIAIVLPAIEDPERQATRLKKLVSERQHRDEI